MSNTKIILFEERVAFSLWVIKGKIRYGKTVDPWELPFKILHKQLCQLRQEELHNKKAFQ